jgi:carbonic anhydrase
MSNQQLSPPGTGSGIGRASGFELTSPGQPGAPNVGAALERNRAFAAARGHHGAVVFPKLRLFVITCLDPRVDPTHFLGLGLGDAMVIRNVGGRVTPEVINDVVFIGQLVENVLPDGPLFGVAVIHHTQCGTGALADDTFRRRYAQRIAADEAALRERAVLHPAATVTRDVERLRSAPAISPRVTFSGHVYDVVTGLVETVIPAYSSAARTNHPDPARGHNNQNHNGSRDQARPLRKQIGQLLTRSGPQGATKSSTLIRWTQPRYASSASTLRRPPPKPTGEGVGNAQQPRHVSSRTRAA